MFQQSQANRFEITRNQKQNPSSNKMMAYFKNSSFLAQQEELATFIKNLPIINIEEISSINKLIDVLIKQNEVLAGKCQQNIVTVKEMFMKHDELIRINRQLQAEIQKKDKMVQYNNLNQRQIDSYEGQLTKVKAEIAEKEDTVAKLTQITEQLMNQNKQVLQNLQDLAEIVRLLGERNFKKCGQKVKELTSKDKNNWDWLDFSGLETLFKEEKKRMKYTGKIKETVELFCSRFMKISEYVPVEIIKEQFNKEVSNLLEILDDLLLLKRKNTSSNSQSRLTVDCNADTNFFEGLLDKILREKESSNLSREEIAGELMSVKEELEKTKKYYEEYLINVKLQYEGGTRGIQEELTEKTQLLEYYQEEKEKTIKEMKNLKQHLQQLENSLKLTKQENSLKQQLINGLQMKLEQAKVQGSLKESQIRVQWEENVRTYQYKLAQKQELLEEEQTIRKNLKKEIEEERSQAKERLSDVNERESRLIMSNKKLEETTQLLTETLDKTKKQCQEEIANREKSIGEKNKQIEDLIKKKDKESLLLIRIKQELESAEKEKNLQSTYIKEIEQKNKQLLGKIKNSEARKSEEKTAKKEMDTIKRTMLEEKKYCRQVEENLQEQKEENQKQKEENQTLKNLIKGMKKELEEVYRQFNQLKSIESDRERLMVEMQRSDRVREDLIRNIQALKAEVLRLGQDNKALILEVKHFKSALNRIEALRL